MSENNYTVIRVIVDNLAPYIWVNEKNSSIISGYMGELWGIVENALQFRNKFIRTNFREGKNFLINGSVDIILLPIVVTSTDAHEFDFSVPVAKSWYELYTKQDGDGATSVSYIETWNPNLWLAFVSTILTLSIILWIILKVRKNYSLEVHKTTRNLKLNRSQLREFTKYEGTRSTLLETQQATLFTCFLIVLGTTISQGFNINTRSTSLRIIMLVVLLFGLLMLNSYSAVLVSRLAVDKVDILFPTLESVVERNSHVLCVRDSSFAYRLFKENESDSELMPVWVPFINKPPCENVTSVSDIANALCQDKTVILESPHIITSVIKSKKCAINRMPGRYATAYTSLLMRKHFKFKKKINELLRKLLTGGIIDYLQRKWLSRRLPRRTSISNKPVTINHINGILFVYAIIIILSLLILTIQKCCNQRKRTRLVTLEYVN